MHVLVTGSEGRIGRHILDRLIADGHQVTGFDRKAQDQESRSVDRYVQAEMTDVDALRTATDGVDAVIHAAAAMSWSDADAQLLYDVNVSGTRALLEAVSGARLQRFVFVSTGEVYPENLPMRLPIDEHHPTKPVSHYGMTKLLGEELVRFYGRKFDLPFTILRIEHTQDAAELLDPTSFFSGARFFLLPKIQRMRDLGAAAQLAVLEALDDGTEKLVVSCDTDGRPYRMVISESRDTASGIVAAVTAERAIGETIGLSSGEAIDFEAGVQLMAAATALPVVRAKLPGARVDYVTSGAKARELLGFVPQWDFAKMVAEAAGQIARSR